MQTKTLILFPGKAAFPLNFTVANNLFVRMKLTAGKKYYSFQKSNSIIVLPISAWIISLLFFLLLQSFKSKRKCFYFGLLLLFQTNTGWSQVVINEIGIAPAGGNNSGGEFIELFNKSACAVDLSCYTIVFSSTSGALNPTGWTLKIPSGYSIPSCGYFVIGGISGQAGITGTGYPTGGTVTPYTGTANLNIGTTAITANAVYMLQSLNAGTFPDAGGQLTLLNSTGTVIGSVAYGNGNDPGSYPLSTYTTCNASGNIQGINNIPDPGNSANSVGGAFSSGGNQGIYLNSSGIYQATNLLTPGSANPSQLSCAPAISFTNVTSNSPLCAANTLTLIATASGGTGPLSYSWNGPNGFSSSLQNTAITNVTTAAGGVYTVKATDADGCNVSAPLNVTINPLPASIIIYHN